MSRQIYLHLQETACLLLNLNFLVDIGVHALFAGTFGYVGYWAHRWEVRSEELLAKKEAQIKENRRLRRLQDLERENARVLQHERELEDAQSA